MVVGWSVRWFVGCDPVLKLVSKSNLWIVKIMQQKNLGYEKRSEKDSSKLRFKRIVVMDVVKG